MECLDIIKNRRTVRSYLPDPVEDEKLQAVLEAARLAPTAANRQPFRLIVLHTAGKEAEIMKVYAAEWLAKAPLIICACSIPAQGWTHFATGKNYCDVDAAIAMDHLILTASGLGLGTCWIAAFNHEPLRHLLRLPATMEPVVLTPLGYPEGTPGPRIRRPMDDLVRYERWHD
jgi:nitroreductase